ncbi:alpha/beta fold hydrolase [Rubritalea spongiae]|uniref:Alpha/beta fold hydrolase n=1 Tax=Rubritalea spongiae TaxID=430797 RepID=A0ABW5E6S4_9BACT
MAAPTSFTSFDTTPFALSQWGNAQKPKMILIGIHGFCGASNDFTGLATQLTSQLETLCVYAYNLRGMGLDPVPSRIGDIDNPDYWIRDLQSLVLRLKLQHPQSKIICCGESLGALIALHTCAYFQKKFPCDGLVLLSPVVSLEHHISSLKLTIAHTIARISPTVRIPMQRLIGDQTVKVTQASDNHLAQSQTNPWHVSSFTLRSLSAIVGYIQSASQSLQQLTTPSLIIYGGKDFFTSPRDVETFIKHAPDSAKPASHYFPDAYHLLLYDTQASKIFQLIADWLELSYCQPARF